MPSMIEEKVDALKKLRKKADVFDAAMRDIRLGAEVDMRFKRFFWRDMVIAYGWGHQKSEPLPKDIEREFYTFLWMKLEGVEEEVRQAEKHLESLSDPKEPVS